VTPEQKIVQYLNEAHALEAALVQTLTAHIAIAPRSEYRDLLERHLGETQQQAGAILGRLSELGESRNPLELVYGIAQTAIGQVIAAGKLPLDLLRGTGGEEKLLKNARDEAASEALEIATYDSIEALAEASGDERTAELARTHREQEETFLRDLRALIPQLARDVLEAEAGGGGSFDVARTGAADAARAVASEVRRTVEQVGGAASGGGGEPGGEGDDGGGEARAETLPIEGYDELSAQQIVPKLRLLSVTELGQIEAHEQAGRQRKAVLNRIATLRSQTNGSAPAGRA
jgi:ferritin-like metal-binding protein YciE